MKKLRLGIDIDGVITDFEGYWMEEAAKWKQVRGQKVVYYPQYGLERAYGFRNSSGDLLEDGEKEFIRDTFLGYANHGSIRKYASEVLHILHERGHYIVIVTKRHLTYVSFGYKEDRAKEEVIKFLKENDIYYDEIVFAEESGNKREECERLSLDLLLDDCPYVVDELYGSIVKVVMMTMLFNAAIKNVDRVYSWYEFLYYIDKLSGYIV